MTSKNTTLRVRQDGAILRVTISNPPINLMNDQLVGELYSLTGRLATDSQIRVVVFDSADPDFFLSHFDLEALGSETTEPSTGEREGQPKINPLQALTISWLDLPQVLIAKIDGRCRGGGLELTLGMDMRFATPTSRFASPEPWGGFLACGGGTTRVALMAGPARALEYLMAARDFDGLEAERYGLINRALPQAELNTYVDDLVARIALHPSAVIAMHRAVFKEVYSARTAVMVDGFVAEMAGFRSAVARGDIARAVAAGLPNNKNRQYELDLPAKLAARAGLRR